jgi:hypothetical protein
MTGPVHPRTSCQASDAHRKSSCPDFSSSSEEELETAASRLSRCDIGNQTKARELSPERITHEQPTANLDDPWNALDKEKKLYIEAYLKAQKEVQAYFEKANKDKSRL